MTDLEKKIQGAATQIATECNLDDRGQSVAEQVLRSFASSLQKPTPICLPEFVPKEKPEDE